MMQGHLLIDVLEVKSAIYDMGPGNPAKTAAVNTVTKTACQS